MSKTGASPTRDKPVNPPLLLVDPPNTRSSLSAHSSLTSLSSRESKRSTGSNLWSRKSRESSRASLLWQSVSAKAQILFKRQSSTRYRFDKASRDTQGLRWRRYLDTIVEESSKSEESQSQGESRPPLLSVDYNAPLSRYGMPAAVGVRVQRVPQPLSVSKNTAGTFVALKRQSQSQSRMKKAGSGQENRQQGGTDAQSPDCSEPLSSKSPKGPVDVGKRCLSQSRRLMTTGDHVSSPPGQNRNTTGSSSVKHAEIALPSSKRKSPPKVPRDLLEATSNKPLPTVPSPEAKRRQRVSQKPPSFITMKGPLSNTPFFEVQVQEYNVVATFDSKSSTSQRSTSKTPHTARSESMRNGFASPSLSKAIVERMPAMCLIEPPSRVNLCKGQARASDMPRKSTPAKNLSGKPRAIKSTPTLRTSKQCTSLKGSASGKKLTTDRVPKKTATEATRVLRSSPSRIVTHLKATCGETANSVQARPQVAPLIFVYDGDPCGSPRLVQCASDDSIQPLPARNLLVEDVCAQRASCVPDAFTASGTFQLPIQEMRSFRSLLEEKEVDGLYSLLSELTMRPLLITFPVAEKMSKCSNDVDRYVSKDRTCSQATCSTLNSFDSSCSFNGFEEPSLSPEVPLATTDSECVSLATSKPTRHSDASLVSLERTTDPVLRRRPALSTQLKQMEKDLVQLMLENISSSSDSEDSMDLSTSVFNSPGVPSRQQHSLEWTKPLVLSKPRPEVPPHKSGRRDLIPIQLAPNVMRSTKQSR